MKIFKSKFFIGFFVVVFLVVAGGLTADAYTHTITLKQGSSGAQVVSLQSALGGLVADGSFGPLTKTAVKAFQLARGFSVDGIVGPITGTALSNINVGSFPAGCTSIAGYSPTTGLACNGITINFSTGCASPARYSTINGSPCFRSGSHSSSRQDTIISTSAIAGVTVPVTGETPTATIADTTEYTATITWSDSPETFASATIYTATITITPKSGYTLTGVTENFFTVAGATATNAINSGVVSAVFPETETIPVSSDDRYWVGGSGSWLDAENHWATTSGGLPGADNLPTEDMNIIFDSNSELTDGSVSLDATVEPYLYAVCKNITSTTGVSFSFTEGNAGFLEIHGSITLESGNSFETNVTIVVYGGNGTITSNNAALSYLQIISGTYELLDEITVTDSFVFYGTLFNTNNHNITAADFYIEAPNNDVTFNMGSSIFTATSGGTAWQVTEYEGNTVTINSGTSTIISTGSGGAGFYGGGKTYYNLEFSGDPAIYDEFGSPSNYVAMSGSNIFNTFTIGPGIPTMFPTLSPQTMNSFIAVGTEANPIEIYSDDNNPSTSIGSDIVVSSGIVSGDYLDISFINATGGATFYAGAHSTDGGHNTGWIFTGVPE